MAKNEEPHHLLICDAGPLIHLDELSCLYLLADFQRILVPEAVWSEVERHRPGALEQKDVRLEKIQVPSGRSPQLEALSRALTLHRGEEEALQLALQAPHDCIVLTDDTAARLAAKSLSLLVHGTIGILVRAIRREQLTREEVVAKLRDLPNRSTLHIRVSFLASIIEQVDGIR